MAAPTQPPTETPAPTGTMHAVVQRAYGDAGVLELEDVPVPVPDRGEVLLRVEAAAIDRGTWHLMTGTPRMLRPFVGWRGPRGTYVPGRDVAGTVVALGAGVTRFRVGDRVFGAARGSLAEYATAQEARLAHQPAGATPVQAAVLAISGLTALQALDAARVGARDRVLVTGASGGVGAYAVQLAVARGAVVTGVCSAAKADAVRRWGASRVLDYATTDPTEGEERYDAIIDVAGGAPLHRLRRVLEPRGALVFVGSEAGGEWTGGFGRPLRWVVRMLLSRQRFVLLTSREKAVADLERLARAVEDGSLVPPVHGVHPLADVREAMEELSAGHVVGKVAVAVREAGDEESA
ncbi:NAD(P)-dependent alcohol dehydrogenase [Nocardioides coralli]|uniref:NAD(P)-dependent alcohol dehydrogenase n=1 Tax=Nocardioides coralli TaxID=2872154 RepID=UPI001CA3AECD|nr:NAD(P)-dependent alcohol dehydrogenase [Nocardioides coralli]QZY28951.1 NAD(P)-dependent alcohol dehydrogenase [Nocardioides coralli]